MPYRFIPMILFAFLTTYVGQDTLYQLIYPTPEQGRIVGIPEIIDGDTLKIQDTRIRLYGIDAPERQQPAIHPNGVRFDAGELAAQGLRQIIGPRRVECHWRSVDVYDRPLGICSMTDGTEINATLVDQGLAFPYWEGELPWLRPVSPEYAVRGLAARIRGAGLYPYRIASPAEYRAAMRARQSTDQAAAEVPE